MATTKPKRILTDCMRNKDGTLRDDKMNFVAYWDSEKVLFAKECLPKEYLIETTLGELRAILQEAESCN